LARRIRLLLGAALVLCAPARGDAGDLLQNGTERVELEALSFLKSLPREWSGTSKRDCRTYEDKNIDMLAGPFAVSSAGLLRAFVAVHGSVTITSAYRSPEEQACVCEGEKGPCAGRPRVVKRKRGRHILKGGTSRHQHGIALDVRAGTGSDAEFACMHEFAQLNPQFGVWFPLGKRDRPHLEPAALSQKKLRLALLGVLPAHVTPCAKMKIMLTDVPVD
jgi:hypothetical protein